MRIRDKEKVRAYNKKFRENNPNYQLNWQKIKREEANKIARKSRLKIKYNITEEQYQKLLSDQNYKCAICNNDFDLNNSKLTHVDHSHENQKVRGLLCHNCNRGLGYFKDNIELLNSAISYLNRKS